MKKNININLFIILIIIISMCFSTISIAFADDNSNLPGEGEPRIGETKILNIKTIEQEEDNYCGPANLEMILKHFGIIKSQDILAVEAQTGNYGSGEGTRPGHMATCLNRNLGALSYGYYRTRSSDRDFYSNVIDSIRAGYPVACLVQTDNLPIYHDTGKKTGHWLLVKGFSIQTGTVNQMRVYYNDPINDDTYEDEGSITYWQMEDAMELHESDSNGYYVAKYGY